MIDDVLYTGRTIRAAMDAVMDLADQENFISSPGRSWASRIANPCRSVGKNIPTSRAEEILVEMQELDGQDRIMI